MMTPLSTNEVSTLERQRVARERFFARDELRGVEVDPAVVRGWRRCLDLGFEADRPVVFRAVQASRLSSAREASRPLLTAAGDEVAQLAEALAPSGATVILTDHNLVTLTVRGRAERMGREMRSLAREGVELAERSIGSTALSVAAAEQDLAVVLNNGHFFSANAVFACAAAPLRAPTGAMLGILDVTTCRAPLPSGAPFLVSAAAKAIENGLFRQDDMHLVIHFHPRPDFVGTPLEAIVSCTVDGEIVGANQAALALLQLRWPLRGVRFERCFRQPIGDLLLQAGRLDRFSIGLVTHGDTPVTAAVRMPRRGVRVNVPVSRFGAVPDLHSAQRHIAQGAWQEAAAEMRDLAAGGAGAPALDPPTPAIDSPALTIDSPALTLDPPDGAVAADVDAAAPWLAPDVGDRALLALRRRIPLMLAGESGSGKGMTITCLARRLGPLARPTITVACDVYDGAAGLPDDSARSAFAAQLRQAEGGLLVLEGLDVLPRPLQRLLIGQLNVWQHGRRQLAPRVISTVLGGGMGGGMGGSADGGVGFGGVGGGFDTASGRPGVEPTLLYRLKGLQIDLPALRHRHDREALIDSAWREHTAGLHGGPVQALPAEVKARLLAYGWPGNLHELGWVMRYLAAMAVDGRELSCSDLPTELLAGSSEVTQMPGPSVVAIAALVPAPGMQTVQAETRFGLLPGRARASAFAGEDEDPALARPCAADPDGRLLRDLAQQAIEQALLKHRGNLSSAARELGISRGTLYRRLRTAAAPTDRPEAKSS